MRKLLTATSILLLINTIRLAMRSWNNNVLFSLGFLVGVAIYAMFYDKLKKIKILNYTLLAAALFSVVVATFAMLYGRRDTATFQEDVVIVLGMAVWGEQVSPALERRLYAALEYHARNPDAIIVVSGGLGSQATITEAEAMSRFLQAAGVPREQIIQEGRSHSTFQNMTNSMAILEGMFPDGFSMTVITNDFHIYRGVRFARMVGVENVTNFHADTPPLTLPGHLFREVAAIIKLWVTGT